MVAAAVAEGLAGLECLSGIPGRAGATPIQNVGAYGHEVAEVITRCGYSTGRTSQIRVIPNDVPLRLPHQPLQEQQARRGHAVGSRGDVPPHFG